MAWKAEKHIILNLQKKEIKSARKLEIELLTAIRFLLWFCRFTCQHFPVAEYLICRPICNIAIIQLFRT